MWAAIGLVFVQAPVTTIQEIRAALANAQPGRSVRIAPGTYPGFAASDLHGTDRLPIVITAADPKNPPLFTSGIQLSKISHLNVSSLVIRGATTNGLNIDDGGEIEKPSHHVRLRGIKVSDLPKGNHDGIKLSGLNDFVVEDCDLSRWGGSGIDMVGCHRGIILNCTFREGGDNGVQAKGGSSDVVVRRSLFFEAGQRGVNLGGSTGEAFFRPALSKMGIEKYEAKNLTVEGCSFRGSMAPIAFVGVDGARVRFNTIVNPGRWAIRILQETRTAGFVPSRNGVFENNLIVADSDKWASGGVNVGDGTDSKSFRFANNWWFGAKPSLPSPETAGTYDRNPMLDEQMNPKAGSPAMKVGAHAFRP